ncbi:MAG: hypothetical protein QW719_03240, partial [Candidatus Micrarchaeaceae archaeon]
MQKLSLLMPIMLLLLVGVSEAAPSAIPANIVDYVQLNLSASWNVGHGAFVQQMVNITESAYSNYLVYNNNFANFEYFYSNGTIIPAWIESNSSGKLITWVKIKNTTTSFYLGFASKTTNLLSSSGTSGIGEAPQLSSTYAEYDDGASVFNFYNNFAGTTLSSLISNASGIKATQNNGLQLNITTALTGSTGNTYYTMINQQETSPFIFESLITVQNAGAGTNFQEGLVIDSSTNVGQDTGGGLGGTNYMFRLLGSGSSNFNINEGSTQLSVETTSAITYPYTSMESFQQNATGLTAIDNGNKLTASTTALTSGYLGFYSYSNAVGNSQFIQYVRVRAYPPNGVMPSVTFGAVQSTTPTLTITPNPAVYGQSITITATCPASSDSCAIAYPNLTTTLASGTGTATYTYNAFSIAAGTFSSYYAVDKTAGLNSTALTLTINKNSTYAFSLTNCTTGALPYSCTTTGSIATHSNQLLASLYLNNNLVGSTNTIITSTVANQIGSFLYTFNTTGNTNYTAKSLSVLFYKSVPLIFYNITAGALGTHSVVAPKTTTLSTYYPYMLSVSAFNGINYTLTKSYNSGTPTTLFSAVNSISYTPPANQLTGNYLYSLSEMQGSTSLLFNLSLIPANMLSISSFSTNPSTCIQYLPCLATVAFTAKPTSWKIVPSGEAVIDEQQNITATTAPFSSAYTSITNFPPAITLTYGQFSPAYSFSLNATNNPAVPTSLTQSPFTFTIANSINANLRDVANFSIFNEQTFNGIANVNMTLLLQGNINAYTFNVTVSNTTTLNGKYFLEIPKSSYINPNITFAMNYSLAPPPSNPLFAAGGTFCPTTISATQVASYPLGMVNANGSKYDFYVYTSSGTSASGYIMETQEGKGVGEIQVQSYKIPPQIPFALPLESTGQAYAFDIFSPNCKTEFYTGALSVPTNPIYITLSSLSTAYIYNISRATASCALNSTIKNG